MRVSHQVNQQGDWVAGEGVCWVHTMVGSTSRGAGSQVSGLYRVNQQGGWDAGWQVRACGTASGVQPAGGLGGS